MARATDRRVDAGLRLGQDLRSLADGLDHPEGICWSPREGVLYAGGEAGQLYRVTLDGGDPELVTTIPGGFLVGLTIDGVGDLHVAESSAPAVVRVPLEGGEAETVVDLEREIPDGLAFDADGGLWISCWQPNRILRLTSSGELEVMVDDWSGIHLFTPTNIAFAGAALDILAIACLGGWSIRAIDPGVRGAPLPSPISRRP